MIVVDASAVIEILLRPERNRLLLARVLDSGQSLVAPHILDLEVTQVLRRYATGREISASRPEAAFEDYRGLRISRYPHTPLLSCDTALAAVPGHGATVDVMGR
jgi:predicted nucleic acid-binding protein